MIRFIRFVLGFGVVLSIATLGAGFLGAIHPAFDTASHMRLHLTVGMIILAGLAFIFSLRRIAMICFLCALAGGFTTLDSVRILAKTETALPEKPIYLHFHMNLLWKNADKESVVRKIVEIDPLLISVTEVSRRWNRVLKPLDKRWKHSASCPEFGIRGGTRIYSKLPLDRQNEFCGPYGTFIMSHMVLDDGRQVAVGSVHPRWPWPASGPSHYRAFEPALANIGKDALISGDFNAVPWSYSVKRFAEIGGMKIFPGIGGTFFSQHLSTKTIQILGLPIDLIMEKGGVRILSSRTIENLGSDHLPLVTEFQLD